MKKMLALLLALALCLTLCACGPGASDAKSSQPAERESGGALIPKPGETKESEAPTPLETAKPAEKPKETPADQPKETPEPAPTEAPKAAEIEVTDLCCVSGKYLEAGTYLNDFSFRLPEISGPDTPYIQSVNEQVRALYDDYVIPALDYMAEELSLMRYCMDYYYGVRDGVHSVLITCDSDWGMDEYWCFNFDDAGNEADNKTVLKSVGLKPKEFVSIARDYFEQATDLSEYFEDDGWKELQAQTTADDNCNAELPMVILPNGNLCFIGTIYTLAGAGKYDHALEINADRSVSTANVGWILLNRLEGTYLLEQTAGEDDEGFAPSEFLEIFTVGDTITMEITDFEPEYGSVYSYSAVDILPEDPAALLRADGTPVRVRLIQHCPDVFTGSYFGETGYYTMIADQNGITFTDYDGGTPLVSGADSVYAARAWRDDCNLDYPIPDTDYEKFDFDAAEASGLVGVWSGYYRDEDYQLHSLTLELSSWGRLRMRDCAGSEIPRIVEGGWYIAKAGDDMAPEGAVVFNLVARGGYKMPLVGYCWMGVDDDGTLLISEDTDSYMDPLTKTDPDYAAALERVPAVRYVVEPEIRALEEGERVYVDIAADGTPEEIGYEFVRDHEHGDAIDSITFFLEGEDYTLHDAGVYDAEVWLAVPGLSGAVYLYIDGQSDNDRHYTMVIGFSQDDVWFAGDLYGGFEEAPTDVENMLMGTSLTVLSTVHAARRYRIGINGLPEAVEPYYRVVSDLTLTTKREIDCWTVDPATGALVDTAEIPAGTEGKLFRTDGAKFMDLVLDTGDVRRVWVDTYDWPMTVDGIDIEECFDGIIFAG